MKIDIIGSGHVGASVAALPAQRAIGAGEDSVVPIAKLLQGPPLARSFNDVLLPSTMRDRRRPGEHCARPRAGDDPKARGTVAG
jgi:predicted dinucleotide-binding enzyme